MAKKIAILPAAGEADRFNGQVKCLLPISETETLLDHAIQFLPEDTDEVRILVNKDNNKMIKRHLARRWEDAIGKGKIKMFTGGDTMWKTIWAGVQTGGTVDEADYFYVIMPDTYFDHTCWEKLIHGNIRFALFLCQFTTREPERFGVLMNGKVLNKFPIDLHPGQSVTAWGAFGFSGTVVNKIWDNKECIEGDYTFALNTAIKNLAGYGNGDMKYYYDIADFEQFENLILDLSTGLLDMELPEYTLLDMELPE